MWVKGKDGKGTDTYITRSCHIDVATGRHVLWELMDILGDGCPDDGSTAAQCGMISVDRRSKLKSKTD